MTDRELTILAAEKVLNRNVIPGADDHIKFTVPHRHPQCWSPLTDDADTFLLVDALDPTDFSLEKSGLNWTANFSTGCATCTDRRRAIVLACLRAVGVEVDE